MMKKNLFYTFFLYLTVLGFLRGQQQVSVVHYMFNGLIVNPAYAGIHGKLSGSVLYKNQWSGIEGSPETQIISAHMPLHSQKNSALGGLLYRDTRGLFSQYSGNFSYAYRIKMKQFYRSHTRFKTLLRNKFNYLAFGFQASLSSVNFNYSRPNDFTLNAPNDGGDPNYIDVNSFNWNVGAGIMYHSDIYYIGIGVPQLLTRKVDLGGTGEVTLLPHYYISGGYVMSLHPRDYFILKPNILIRMSPGSPIQTDFNINLFIKQRIWTGVSYRNTLSISGLVGFQATSQLMVSYSAGYSLSRINRTTHEVMVNYVFDKALHKHISPRFF